MAASHRAARAKAERNFPCPNWRLNHRLAVVTGSPSRTDSSCGELARDRAARNIDTFARHDAVLPRLVAQFFEPLFGWRISRHEKNANANSVAMMDAIAVANADVHADFK